jgi:type I restriction enzyme R subunit
MKSVDDLNQRAEDKARDNIDEMLRDAGWVVHSKGNLDFSEGVGVAIREYPTDTGPADYVLFVNSLCKRNTINSLT